MRCAAAVLCCIAAVCLAACGTEPAGSAAPQATMAGITIVEETGLLEAEELPENTFAFEIMPEADDHIAQMQIQYSGGEPAEFLGQLVLEPETDRYFTREDTFRRGFTVPDEALLKDFTLSFVFVDENGTETEAKNEYKTDADYGIFYFLKIGGSRDAGYVIESH